jgi:hypothetical protein
VKALAPGFFFDADLAAFAIEFRCTAAVNLAGLLTFLPDDAEYIFAPVAAYAFAFRTFVPRFVTQPVVRELATLL